MRENPLPSYTLLGGFFLDGCPSVRARAYIDPGWTPSVGLLGYGGRRTGWRPPRGGVAIYAWSVLSAWIYPDNFLDRFGDRDQGSCLMHEE